jgi:signal transduction histidine kinase
MSPTATLRLRRATALIAILWALVALGLGVEGNLAETGRLRAPFGHGGVSGRQVVHAMTAAAADAGVSAGDLLVEVDGMASERWLRAGRPGLSAGQRNHYRFRKPGGEVFEVALAPASPAADAFRLETALRILVPLLGGVYLLIAGLVWRLRRDRADAWALLLFSSAMATQLFLSGPLTRGGALQMWMNLPLIGATAFHLFTTYPLEPDWIVRRPGLRFLPYGLAAALALGVWIEPWLPVFPGLVAQLGFGLAIFLGIGCMATLTAERWQHRGDPGIQRFDVMLAGSMVSFLPLLLVVLTEYLFQAPYPWYLGLVGVFVFPAAIGYGIVRNQLFDIRLVARSSAAHGAVTLLITGLFALTISFADALFARFNVDARARGFSIGFLFFAILLFNPVRSRVQRIVDSFFDRDRAQYRSAVREISEAMVSMLSLQEIVERILLAVTDTMGVERAMVLLLQEGDQRFAVAAERGDWDEDSHELVLTPDHPLCRFLWMRREELARSDFDDEQDPEVREACRDVFDTLAVELLVPVLYGVDLLGLIAVGRKLTGERLGPDDRQLLRTLANQSSIAIENAKAFDEIAQLNETLEARVERRTEELQRTQAQLVQSEKMRSLGQLVAGVAHELNNPIGFVHANLQLLQGYVARLDSEDPKVREHAREAIAKLLSRSREGTTRVRQIVQDLRAFSRMDHAELQEVDLNEEIDRTLALAEQRFKDQITVERDYERLPPVRCYAGQLNQVFMNLVINACDAMGSRGTLRVRTRATGEGVRLEFNDDGPGLGPELRDRIFEPFFTTKPVGQGTGLGLSLSHGIIERHGGRMWVESERGQGASFVIELPRVAKPPAEPGPEEGGGPREGRGRREAV